VCTAGAPQASGRSDVFRSAADVAAIAINRTLQGGGEVKSALELAMQKINARQERAPVASLTEAQRLEIGELRKQYEAKIAEKEIMMQAEMRSLARNRPPQEAAAKVQELQAQFQESKKALQEELEAKVSALRDAS